MKNGRNTYLCWADDGSQGPEDAEPYEADLAREAAEMCAEREYSESAGENPSPIDIHVQSSKGAWTVWSVATDYTVSFKASPKVCP